MTNRENDDQLQAWKERARAWALSQCPAEYEGVHHAIEGITTGGACTRCGQSFGDPRPEPVARREVPCDMRGWFYNPSLIAGVAKPVKDKAGYWVVNTFYAAGDTDGAPICDSAHFSSEKAASSFVDYVTSKWSSQ